MKVTEGLEHCILVDVEGCKDCPYKDTRGGCINQLEKDALAYIKELEAKNKAFETILLNIKRDIKSNAIFPHNSGIAPYVTLKAVNAIINAEVRKLHK